MNALFFFVIASVATVSMQQSVQQTIKEWRNLIDPHMSRCMCQSGANSDQVESFFQFGELSNNPCFKCNLRCWAEGIGILTSTGNVNATRFGSIPAITDEIVHKCGSNNHVDLCEKAYEVARCTFGMVQAAAASSTMVLPVAPVPVVPKVKVWDPVTQYFMANNGYVKTKFG